MYVSPFLRTFLVVSAVLVVPNQLHFIEKTQEFCKFENASVTACQSVVNNLFAHELAFLNGQNQKQDCCVS